jgi:site-specific DNA-cytosine methylase
MWENVKGVATLNGGAALAKFKENSASDGFPVFLSQCVDFFHHNDPENRTRRLGVAFHKSVNVEAAGEFEFPAPIGECNQAANYLECSANVPNRFWDVQTWTPVDRKWKKGDRKIFTLGFCNLHDTIGYPLKPSRVFHMMGLFPTALASGNTGLV